MWKPAVLMYKVKYGLAQSIVDELFKQKSTSYSLRNSDFDILRCNTILILLSIVKTMESTYFDINDLKYGRN